MVVLSLLNRMANYLFLLKICGINGSRIHNCRFKRAILCQLSYNPLVSSSRFLPVPCIAGPRTGSSRSRWLKHWLTPFLFLCCGALRNVFLASPGHSLVQQFRFGSVPLDVLVIAYRGSKSRQTKIKFCSHLSCS
jgi:hypothetical protein